MAKGKEVVKEQSEWMTQEESGTARQSGRKMEPYFHDRFAGIPCEWVEAVARKKVYRVFSKGKYIADKREG